MVWYKRPSTENLGTKNLRKEWFVQKIFLLHILCTLLIRNSSLEIFYTMVSQLHNPTHTHTHPPHTQTHPHTWFKPCENILL